MIKHFIRRKQRILFHKSLVKSMEESEHYVQCQIVQRIVDKVFVKKRKLTLSEQWFMDYVCKSHGFVYGVKFGTYWTVGLDGKPNGVYADGYSFKDEVSNGKS